MQNPQQLSPATLAFLGDAVYGLLVRNRLCERDLPSGELHSRSVKLVSAVSQSRAVTLIEPMLSQEEMAVFKRGRNAHTSTPRSCTVGQYHAATGLETLFGYLYLKGEHDRIQELFGVIWDNFGVF